MYIGRRILAFNIDFALSLFLGMFVTAGGVYLLDGSIHIVQSLGANSVSFVSLVPDNAMGGDIFALLLLSFWVIGFPSLFIGTCSHVFGRSIGKWIVGLNITNFQGYKPSFRMAFGRELVKIIILFIPFLWLLPLIQLLTQGNTFYDQQFGTVVKGKTKLTDVQRKYMSYYGNR